MDVAASAVPVPSEAPAAPKADEVPAAPETDVALLGRYCACLDMEAFTMLINRHQSDLLRLARIITNDANIAEDVVQEAFLRLCHEGRTLLAKAQGRTELGGWLCTVVRNKSLDHLRQRRTKTLPDHAAQPATPEGTAIEAAQLWAAVAELPPLERTAVLLRYRDHLDYQAVAQQLGKSVNHVGVILHQAMQRLRAHPGLRAEVAP